MSDGEDSGNSSFVQAGLMITCFLSTVSTGGLIGYFIFSKNNRTYGFKLVFPLFLTDFIFSTTILISCLSLYICPTIVIDNFFCNFQGFLELYATLSSFLITATITWTIYSSIVLESPLRVKNPTKHFAIITTVIPLIAATIPLFFGRYGKLEPLNNVMCFLTLNITKSEQTDVIGLCLRLFLQEIPFCIVFIFDLVQVIKIILHMRREYTLTYQLKDTAYLIAYPIVLFVSWIWIIIDRMIEATSNDTYNWLDRIDLPLASLCGFFNAIVYGYISLKPFSKKRENIKMNICDSQAVENKMQVAFDKSKESESSFIQVFDLRTINQDNFTLQSSNRSQNEDSQTDR